MSFRLFFYLFLACLLLPAISLGNPNLLPDGYAGNPPDNQTCIACHGDFVLNSGQGTIGITGIPFAYRPGEVYQIAVFAIHPGGSRFGFQATALDSEYNQAGTLFPFDERTRLSTNPDESPDYISHSLAGTDPDYQAFGWWNFFWIAPPAGTGDVTIYVATVGGDNNLHETGDYVYSSTSPVVEDVSTTPGDGEFFTFWYQHDFGNTPIGNTRVWETIGINAGGDTLRDVTLQLQQGEQFEVLSPSPVLIPPSEVIAIRVAFSPTFSSSFSDSLLITSASQPGTTHTIGLIGFGTAPQQPTPFDLLSPADGDTVSGETITFSWFASTNPDSTSPNVNYQLQLDRESDFSNPLAYDTSHDSSVTINTAPLYNHCFYFWRVLALDTNTEGRYSSDFYAIITDFDPSGIDDKLEDQILPAWSLKASPNPFNSQQKISFSLPSAMNIEVMVYDIQGRQVARPAEGFFSKGLHNVTWHGGTASGVFFIRIKNDLGYSLQEKVLYLK